MMTYELIEKVFEQVQDRYECDWWEIVDSDRIDEVVQGIADRLDVSVDEVLEDEVWEEWYNEACADL